VFSGYVDFLYMQKLTFATSHFPAIQLVSI